MYFGSFKYWRRNPGKHDHRISAITWQGKFEVGKDPRDKKEIERKCSNSEPFSALVFKTVADPYVGKLSIFKVMSGVLDHSVEVYNATQEVKEKANHIYVLNKQIEVEKLRADDMGAFSKLSDTVTGDTLTSIKSPIVYDKIELPKPIISMAIEPKTKRLISTSWLLALHRLVEESPTSRRSAVIRKPSKL